MTNAATTMVQRSPQKGIPKSYFPFDILFSVAVLINHFGG
jgi:hypothetical protein